jgi:hypothetical protein
MFIVLACAALSVIAPPTRAQAAYYHIVNKGSNWCLDSNPAGDVYLNPCQPDSNAQLWERWDRGWTRNVATGLCLVGAGLFTPDSIHAAPCAWGDPQMNWLHWYGGWYERATFDANGTSTPPECLSRVGAGHDVTGVECKNPTGPNPPAEEWYAIEATVAPPPPPPPPPVDPCAPVGTTGGLRLKVTFRHSKRVATATYGRRVHVRGQLLAANGSPVAGAAFCIGEQVSQDGAVKAVATTTSDGQGRFSYTLGPGASRRVWFVHRGVGQSAAAAVALRVRAPVTLRASRRSLRNGQRLALRGRLGGTVQVRGLLVEMQAVRDGHWVPFGITYTRSGGRFHFSYRFINTVGVRTYTIRARVIAQVGSPFETGSSRPVRVRVVG